MKTKKFQSLFTETQQSKFQDSKFFSGQMVSNTKEREQRIEMKRGLLGIEIYFIKNETI